ncbi:MAG: CoxG family protein [Thermoleophilia bacterium]
MKTSARFETNVGIDQVWDCISDPATVARTIPGCEEVTEAEDGTYVSVVSVKVAYLKARFRLVSNIVERQAPERLVVHTKGEGLGIIGNVGQETVVELQRSDDDGTVVTSTLDLTISGTLANLGQRMIKAKFEKLAEDWALEMKSVVEASVGL